MSTNNDLLATLQLELEQLKSSHETMAGKIEALTAENKELKNSLGKKDSKAPEKPRIPTQTFTVGEGKYKFVVASFIKPSATGPIHMTAVDALTDEETLEKLVSMHSGAIIEVAE